MRGLEEEEEGEEKEEEEMEDGGEEGKLVRDRAKNVLTGSSVRAIVNVHKSMYGYDQTTCPIMRKK